MVVCEREWLSAMDGAAVVVDAVNKIAAAVDAAVMDEAVVAAALDWAVVHKAALCMAVLAEGRFDKTGFQNSAPFLIEKSIPAQGRLCKTITKRFGSQSNPCGKMTLAVVLAPRL